MKIKDEIISTTAMLLSIAKADNNVEDSELKSIKDIISDFSKLIQKRNYKLYQRTNTELEKSTDIFEFGRVLNDAWNYQDKLICMLHV